MVIALEEALTALKSADANHIEMNHLGNGKIEILFIPRQKTETKTEEASGKSKWAKIAEEMAEENYLQGQSEEVNKYAHQFRESFSFEREE